MNDIHVSFFILLAIIFYLIYKEKKHYLYLLLTGVSGGLAMGSKWSGLFVVATVGLLEATNLWQMIRTRKPERMVTRKIAMLVISLGAVPLLLYVLSYTHMFLQGKDLSHFIKLHQQIWWYQTNLDAEHSFQSRPWQWFLNARPVWYHVDYIDEKTIGNIYALGNPAVLWLGAVAAISTLIYIADKKAFSNEPLKTQDHNALIILFAYGMTWLPWSLSPRIMFFYHYTPAVPLLSILLAFWLYKIWKLRLENNAWNKLVVAGAVLVTVAVFVIWFPNWTAMPVTKKFADSVYFTVHTWK